MRSTDRNKSGDHISVHWLDTPLPPTRWERMNTGWNNLPAAIVVAVVVLAIILPWSSIPVPDVPGMILPGISLSLSEDGVRISR